MQLFFYHLEGRNRPTIKVYVYIYIYFQTINHTHLVATDKCHYEKFIFCLVLVPSQLSPFRRDGVSKIFLEDSPKQGL